MGQDGPWGEGAFGRQMPRGLSWPCCVLGLECLELDVEIGPAPDPRLSPTEDRPPSRALFPRPRFPGCVPAQEPVFWEQSQLQARDQAVRIFGRPRIRNLEMAAGGPWRWCLQGPTAPCSQPGWFVPSLRPRTAATPGIPTAS